VSIGETLSAARRQAGLTITQVSQRTCIRETIVRGIERGDYSACGGDFYARGHIRSIARAVGLEPEELIREYDATQSPPQPISAADVFQPFRPVKLKERRRTNWSMVLAIAVLAVLGVAGWKYFTRPDHNGHPSDQSVAARQHTTKPKPTVTHKVTTVAAPHVRLTLVAVPGGLSWAEFTSSTGRVLFEGDVGGAGVPRITRTESDPITLDLGYPGGVTVYLNGKKQTVETNYSITLVCTTTACTART
jgi:transcriptional regulator with XRE-family HTH domain